MEEALEHVVKEDDHPKDMSRTTFIGLLVNNFEHIMKSIRTLKRAIRKFRNGASRDSEFWKFRAW
eukprot:4909068-Pyramimonas_sp.AAC.1